MLLPRSQYESLINKISSLQHLIPKHRIFGRVDVKHFYQHCLDLSKIPNSDFQVFVQGDAFLVATKFGKPYNNMQWYGEIAWMNLGNNKKDGISVFLEAKKYSKIKGYNGFIYSSLIKDYSCNRLANFDHAVYGIVFDDQKKTK